LAISEQIMESMEAPLAERRAAASSVLAFEDTLERRRSRKLREALENTKLELLDLKHKLAAEKLKVSERDAALAEGNELIKRLHEELRGSVLKASHQNVR
jgi:hypothetical protein